MSINSASAPLCRQRRHRERCPAVERPRAGVFEAGVGV